MRKKDFKTPNKRITVEMKKFKDYIEEAKKDEGEDEGSSHIVMQLRKSVSLRGNKPVKFNDGKTVKVDMNVAKKFLNKYASAKPNDKEAMQARAAKSYDSLKSLVEETLEEAHEMKKSTIMNEQVLAEMKSSTVQASGKSKNDPDVKEVVKLMRQQLKRYGDLEIPGSKMVKKDRGSASANTGVYEYKGKKYKVLGDAGKSAFAYDYVVTKVNEENELTEDVTDDMKKYNGKTFQVNTPDFKGRAKEKAIIKNSPKWVHIDQIKPGKMNEAASRADLVKAGKELEKLARKGGRDKKDYERAAEDLKSGKFPDKRWVMKLDTEPRDEIIMTIANHVSPDDVLKEYPVKIKEETELNEVKKGDTVCYGVKTASGLKKKKAKVVDVKNGKIYLSSSSIVNPSDNVGSKEKIKNHHDFYVEQSGDIYIKDKNTGKVYKKFKPSEKTKAQSYQYTMHKRKGKDTVMVQDSVEHEINEKLKASDPLEKWISDFVHSDDPKFDGKSKAERIKMAKGAYYSAQKDEAYKVDSALRRLKNFDKSRVAAGKKPIFKDNARKKPDEKKKEVKEVREKPQDEKTQAEITVKMSHGPFGSQKKKEIKFRVPIPASHSILEPHFVRTQGENHPQVKALKKQRWTVDGYVGKKV